VSFKSFEDPRSLNTLFDALLHVCRESASHEGANVLNSFLSLSSFDRRQLTAQEIDHATKSELDVLGPGGFLPQIEMSFDFTDRFVEPIIKQMPEAIYQELRDHISWGHCFGLVMPGYFELPLEVIALGATLKAFRDREIPQPIKKWIDEATIKYGREAVDKFVHYLDSSKR
jgi:hypothetical protein